MDETAATAGKATFTGLWRWAAPVSIAAGLALSPAPAGLAPHAWHFFALFAGIVAALILEPVPPAAAGVIAITLTALLSRWTLFSPAELAQPGMKIAAESAKWAFSGFASSTVWLVGGAFIFALGYERTGLGRRIALSLVRKLGRSPLALGYAATLADTILAPFTPSNTARSAGTLFPIMVQLPPIYGSKPNDTSARKIGGYLLWTTFASSCVSSSLFMTACAPNFLAIDFIRKIAHVEISYGKWFASSAPFAIPLLIALPLLGYLIYPPSIRRSPEAQAWADREVRAMGPPSRKEWLLSALIVMAIIAWVFASDSIDPAIVAFMVVSCMLVLGIVTWADIAGDHAAWTTIVLLATLVAMADGLARTGFITWFGATIAAHSAGYGPLTVLYILVIVYFFSHYFFSSLTAHTTTLMPVMLGIGMGLPGLPPEKLALSLALTTGIMGVISPYATGAALPYYNSGYITSAEFWHNGILYGIIFLAALLGAGIPFL